MKTIPEMLKIIAKQNAQRTAIVDGEKAVTYGAFERNAASLAAELLDLGVCPGDPVALLLPNSLDFVTSYFAIVSTGAMVVPLNNQYQKTELLYFLDEGRVSLMITRETLPSSRK